MLVRTVLLTKSLPQLHLGPALLARIYGTGLFFDLVTFFYFALPFVIYLTALPDRVYNHAWHQPFVQAFFFFVTAALVFNAAAEYLFFDEFGTRYNFIAVDYLVYTREVVGNIRESYPLAPIFAGIFLVTIGIYAEPGSMSAAPSLPRATGSSDSSAGAAFAVVPVLSVLFVDLSSRRFQRTPCQRIAGNGFV